MKTVITERLGLGLCCKLRLWLVSFSSSQIFQSGFVFLCLEPTSYVSQWQVSACNYLCTSHSIPHKKGYQVCIFKTNELLVNTFEAINQRYHLLSTDRDFLGIQISPEGRTPVWNSAPAWGLQVNGKEKPQVTAAPEPWYDGLCALWHQMMTFWGRWVSGTQQKCLYLFCHTCSPSQTSYQSMAASLTTKHLSCCLQGTQPGFLSALSV